MSTHHHLIALLVAFACVYMAACQKSDESTYLNELRESSRAEDGKSRIESMFFPDGQVALFKNTIGPCGVRELHLHPRAYEINWVEKGTFMMGVIFENNTIFQETRKANQGFLWPPGLMHFIFNTECTEGYYYGALGSANPGTINMPSNLAALPKDAVLRDWRTELPAAFPGIQSTFEDCKKKCKRLRV